MPRGDGTGPWGTGPIGRRRGGCQPMVSFNRCGLGFGRITRQVGMQSGFNFASNTPAAPETLETQAEYLEAQAKLLVSQANTLRILAKHNHIAE